MILRLNISPCPNDTFMFHALVDGLIDLEGMRFEVEYHDIEQLNNLLLSGAYAPDVSKMSYATLPAVLDRYALLDSGSALGRGNGPVLVAAREYHPAQYADLRVAIPGCYTTANLLMDRLFPQITDKPEYLFSDIAGAILAGEVDAGVLIHEGRFTYRKRGLHLLCDLGERWEQQTALPLPLGAIVASRNLPASLRERMSRVLRRSIEYAMAHPAASRDYVRSHAQEMSEEVIDGHISMFVNEFSLSLGAEGRAAVSHLLGEQQENLFE